MSRSTAETPVIAHIPVINYGDIVEAPDAELYGATLLGLGNVASADDWRSLGTLWQVWQALLMLSSGLRTWWSLSSSKWPVVNAREWLKPLSALVQSLAATVL